MAIIARVCPHIRDIARADWENCLPGEAENHDYYTACESLPHTAYKLLAVVAELDGRVVAVSPLFTLTYRLDTPLQGAMRRVSDAVSKIFPGLMALKVIGMGSPLAERCHLGFVPELTANERLEATDALLSALDVYAKSAGIGLIAIKDLSADESSQVEPAIRRSGFSRTTSLPIAVLDLPETEDQYFAKLSANNRSSLRRKIKAAKNLTFEYRFSIDGIEAEIDALYQETCDTSGYDYGDLETLPPGYFGAIMKALKGKAIMMLYWLEGDLIGFNLLLLNQGRDASQRKIIDKFIGRKHPMARDHNLYFVGWIDNVRYGLKHGYKMLQSGQTAYGEKLRLGSRLVGSYIYFRHRNGLINLALRALSRFIAFDKMDPDLQAHFESKKLETQRTRTPAS